MTGVPVTPLPSNGQKPRRMPDRETGCHAGSRRFAGIVSGVCAFKAALVVCLFAAQLAFGLSWAEHHAQANDIGAHECAVCHLLASSSPVVNPVVVPASVSTFLGRVRNPAPDVPRAMSIAAYRSRAPPISFI